MAKNRKSSDKTKQAEVSPVEQPKPEEVEKVQEDDCESIAPSEAQTEGGESVMTTTSTASRKKGTVTKEMVMADIDEILDMVEKEILSMRENAAKTRGIRFMKTLNKKIKLLHNHASRVLKQRKPNPNHSTNSGLLKPVKISNELAQFTGWSPNELKSRVEVTTFICKYIKEHNLQNPEDGRKIMPDAKLCKLLKFDADKNNVLTYYGIQSYMKHHFIKEQSE